jgi:thiol-disulfide isomerase/thioredoxin
MRKTIITAAMLALAACSRPAERPGSAKVGEPAPQIELTEILRGDVKEINGWEDFKGKAVVLEFWSPDCEPCVENLPHLTALAGKFSGRPVVFISAALAPKDEVAEFLKDHEMAGIVAADTPMALFRSFKGRGIPHTILIDKDGKVAAFTYPSMVTEETLENLLAGKNLPTIVEEEEEPEDQVA